MNEQTTHRKETPDGVKHFDIHVANTSPSWVRHGKGHAHISLTQYHPDWISMSAYEFNADTGRAREVMFSLSRESVEAMRDFLNEVLK